jgi:hypothetical protein
MARRTIVTLEDDLDAGRADETVRFGIDGSEYEIDLSKKNAAKLRKQLAPFVAHARKAGRTQSRPVRTAASRRRSRDIRVWAKEKGIQLSERGRIPADVVDRYEADTRRGSRRLPAGAPAGRPARSGSPGAGAKHPAVQVGVELDRREAVRRRADRVTERGAPGAGAAE